MAHQIRCVEKTDRYDPTEAIEYIGGNNADGTRWRLAQKDAIAGIKAGKWSFYVHNGGRRTDVIVATSRYGNDYIKTVADDYEPNNLLSLQSCSLDR